MNTPLKKAATGGVTAAQVQALTDRVEFLKNLAEEVARLQAVHKTELTGLIEKANEDSTAFEQEMLRRWAENEALKGKVEALEAVVDELRTKVEGRNKSAAVKRNMTDADAKAVMTGEWKDLGHKAAGEKVGLTYAQVYSCRLEFTFKHVHKELRESGWKNPWVK